MQLAKDTMKCGRCKKTKSIFLFKQKRTLEYTKTCILCLDKLNIYRAKRRDTAKEELKDEIKEAVEVAVAEEKKASILTRYEQSLIEEVRRCKTNLVKITISEVPAATEEEEEEDEDEDEMPDVRDFSKDDLSKIKEFIGESPINPIDFSLEILKEVRQLGWTNRGMKPKDVGKLDYWIDLIGDQIIAHLSSL